MELFSIEFEYFDGSSWSRVKKTILAQSKIQLMKSFINETYCLHETTYDVNKIRPKTRKDLWNEVKKDIDLIQLPYVVHEFLD
jgi:hypothetical protein